MRARELEQVKNLINRFREAKGVSTLDSIPKGVPGTGRECPVARGINFNCHITRDQAIFGDLESAKIFARLINKKHTLSDIHFDHEDYYAVELPKYARNFIAAFDSNKLPEFSLFAEKVKEPKV